LWGGASALARWSSGPRTVMKPGSFACGAWLRPCRRASARRGCPLRPRFPCCASAFQGVPLAFRPASGSQDRRPILHDSGSILSPPIGQGDATGRRVVRGRKKAPARQISIGFMKFRGPHAYCVCAEALAPQRLWHRLTASLSRQVSWRALSGTAPAFPLRITVVPGA
jgi:hypothetical protein